MTPWLSPATGTAASLAAQFQALVPVLDTERLRLRAPLIGDFPTYQAITQSARWPHGDGQTPSGEEAWLDYNQMVASWMLRGIGLFAVDRLADGQLIGFATIDHEWGDPEVEIGWMLGAEAEGHGYATEAGRAILDFTAGQGRTSVVSYVAPGNPRSAAVSERLGGARDKMAEAELDGVLVFRHVLKEQSV